MSPASSTLDFVHRFEPASNGSAVTLLLLHGTGGNEDDLLPLGRTIAPGTALLSPRGNVSENGMPRFFRRIAEGVFDQKDLAFRTDELGRFVKTAAETYGFSPAKLFAVGFSNGANIASSLLLRHPDALAGAVLIRGMVPFQPADTTNLAHKPVLLLSGTQDPIAPPNEAEALESILRNAHANVELHRENAGHSLTNGDVAAARRWLLEHTRQLAR